MERALMGGGRLSSILWQHKENYHAILRCGAAGRPVGEALMIGPPRIERYENELTSALSDER
ncbi:hypothetical protein MSG28_005036 [Choristoneura fumiferana]|uniref:Uncharacterized protein n=1 Tax=Choristoneura fumiferana TaxID=7141 RepID=A0ACC0JPM7_CHOFU|nr:hypothetical protein MSG28_005036 [Choristoneura fumiferana]